MELQNTSRSRPLMRMARRPVRVRPSSNRRGVALLIALAVLVLMALLAVSFYRSQEIESKAASTGAHARTAEAIAQGGLEWALVLLEMDTGDADHNLTLAYDTNFDIWAPRAHESGQPYASADDLLFNGTDVNPFNPASDQDKDCRWIVVRDGLRVTGRFAVIIECENGMLNANVAGNEDDVQAEGLSPAEISLPAFLKAVNPSWGDAEARDIIPIRYGEDGKPGQSGLDDDTDLSIGFVGCDDDLDGTIDNPGEALDEPDEYDLRLPQGDDIRLLDFTTALMNCSNIRNLKTSANASDVELYRKLRRLTTVNSWSQGVHKLKPSDDTVSDDWITPVSVNELPAQAILDMLQQLQDAGRLPPQAPSGADLDLAQIAVNIADFRDEDNEPTEFGGKYGIEPTPYINEVEASPEPQPMGGGQLIEHGEFIELINPYEGEDIEVTIMNVPRLVGTPRERNITVTVPAASGGNPGFLIIGDISGTYVYMDANGIPVQVPYADLTPKAGSLTLGPEDEAEDLDLDNDEGELTLVLGSGSSPVIEVANYPDAGIENSTSAQKNDPRVNMDDNWEGHGDTPGEENANWAPGDSGDEDDGADLNQLFVVYNGPIGSVGHLGRVHIGDPWATINLTGDDVADWDTLPETASWLNIYDVFTTDTLPAALLGRYGLININTAPEEVLSGLKGVKAGTVADDTANGTVFRSIAQIAPYLESPTGTTDWGREQPLADIANLITVQSNTFRITVVAQAVARSGETARVAERRLEATVQRTIVGGTPVIEVISSRWLTED